MTESRMSQAWRSPLVLVCVATAWFVAASGAEVVGPPGPPSGERPQRMPLAQVRALAAERGWATRIERDGRLIELVDIRDGRPIYFTTHNLTSARTINAFDVWPDSPGGATYGLTGDGVLLGVWDGGRMRTSHQEFDARVSVRDGSASDALPDGHATHVGGTVAARGIEAAARGMSYRSTVHSYDWFSDDIEMANAEQNTLIRASNHSYGQLAGWHFDDFGPGLGWYWFGDPSVDPLEDYQFGFYTVDAFFIDDVLYGSDRYLAVWAAGNDRATEGPGPGESHFVAPNGFWQISTQQRNPNTVDGYDSLSPPSSAKNPIVVGAIWGEVDSETLPLAQAFGFTGDPMQTADFSNWGPTDDGRIKPDLVAKGELVYSTSGFGDREYELNSGTSMAAPAVTGGLGLLVQAHRQANSVGASQDMRGETLKALALHTATDADGVPGPDYRTGWGVFNVRAAVDVIRQDATSPLMISEHILTQKPGDNDQNPDPNDGQVSLFASTTAGVPLRVTIAWMDPPGDVGQLLRTVDNPTSVLENDLDLRVTSLTSGAVFTPWVLDPTNPSAAATTGDNARDNVEQVVVPAPAGDVYQIRVTHKRDTLVDTRGEGDRPQQRFSVVVTGASALGVGGRPLVSPQVLSVAEGQVGQFSVQLLEPPGTDTVLTVTRAAGSSDKLQLSAGASQTLTFNNSNWDRPQAVAVTALADVDACDDTATFNITGAAGETTVTAFQADANLSLNVSRTALDLAEGESGDVTVSLSSPPCSASIEVEVLKTTGASNINVVGSGVLTFTAANYNVPQTVRFTASQDDQDYLDGIATFDIVTRTQARVTSRVTVADADDDTLGVVANTNQVRVREGGEAAITLSLNGPPPETIEVAVTRQSGDEDLVVTTGATLTFTAQDFATGQTVRFAAAEDNDRIDGAATFVAALVGFEGDSRQIRVSEIENDELTILADPLVLEVEELSDVNFGVTLNGPPGRPLTVAVSMLPGDPDVGLVGPLSLTFDDTNWDVPQLVTLSAVADSDDVSNSARVQLLAEGLPTRVVVVHTKELVAFARPSTPAQPTPAQQAFEVPLNVTLRWTPSTMASGYEVYLSASGTPGPDDLHGFTDVAEYQLIGLAPETTYRWRVMASNQGGRTGSPTWTFRTQAAQTNNTPNDGMDDPNDGAADPNTPADPNDPAEPADPPAVPAPCGAPVALAMLLLFGAVRIGRKLL